MYKEECLDLVDEDDNVIGIMERNEVYKNCLNNFRVINCFIKNSKGELWIPRRAKNKRLFRECLDMSCGGHVSSGETYLEAFKKEMSEELNIDIEKTEYRELGSMNPKEDGVSAFMKVYEIESDINPDYNNEDFTEFFWIKPTDLLKNLEEGNDKSKDDLPKIVKKFYL